MKPTRIMLLWALGFGLWPCISLPLRAEPPDAIHRDWTVEPDLDVAIAANYGNHDAQFEQGRRCEHGMGTPLSLPVAFSWYLKAAEGEHLKAQVALAGCYLQGKGVAADPEKAVPWLKRAANSRDSEAMHRLGECFMTGKGVAQDEVVALTWHQKAADAGYGPAMEAVGNCLLIGKGGTVKNEAEACRWFIRGVALDDPASHLALGTQHSIGAGVPQDLGLAFQHWRRAAELGSEKAQFKLGSALLTGWNGSAMDRAQGFRWIKLAAARGNEPAREMAAKAATLYFTSREVAEADAWATAFKPSVPKPDLASAPAAASPSPAPANAAPKTTVPSLLPSNTSATDSYMGDDLTTALRSSLNPQLLAFLDRPVAELLTLAHDGNPSAHLALGCIYQRGLQGEPKNAAAARSHLRAAARAGIAAAQLLLAVDNGLVADGQHSQNGDDEQLQWAMAAARSGYPLGYLIAGLCRARSLSKSAGPQRQKHTRDMIDCFEKAADAGIAAACETLGEMYRHEPALRDLRESYRWYARGAALDSPRCLYAAACRLKEGEGVARNPFEAIRLWRLAAEQGHADSQDALALELYSGEFVQPDPVESCVWIQLAAKAGRPDLDAGAEFQTQSLTVEQRAQVSARVAAFKPRSRKIPASLH